jgi:choline monooxygenase
LGPEILPGSRSVAARGWQFLAQADIAKAGQYLASEVAGYRFFVIRGRDGLLRGFHNVCPHRASILLDDGRGQCDLLRCRYHGWVFDSTGRLRKAPDFGEADWFRLEDHGLKPIRVETWRGLVFISLEQEPVPLAESLGALPALLAPTRSRLSEDRRGRVRDGGQRKAYTDNFVEGYHVPVFIRPSTRSSTSFEPQSIGTSSS